jgi:hypothetical protein
LCISEALEPKQANNIKSGFRKCGIFPLNKDEVLPRVFCSKVNDAVKELSINQAVSDAVLHRLNQIYQVGVCVKQRKRRINVVPGKSISLAEFRSLEDEEVEGEEEVKRQR